MTQYGSSSAVSITEGVPFDLNTVEWGGRSLADVAVAAEEVGRQVARDLGLRTRPVVVDRVGRNYLLKVTGLAGFISVARKVIQVAPKFVDSESAASAWERCVVAMLSRARRRDSFVLFPVTGLSIQRLLFLDHVAFAYATSLERAQRGDPILVFRNIDEEGRFLRGALDAGRQLREILTRPHILHYRVDQLDADNQFNHLLRWAGETLSRLVFDGKIARRLDSAVAALPVISGPPRLPSHLVTRPPPQYAHYAEALDIAATVARGMGHGQWEGQLGGYGYALDMEVIFEGFIESSLHRACQLTSIYRADSQVSSRYAFSLSSKANYFTRPDNVVYEGDVPRVLVDAKYKRLADAVMGSTKKPSNADVYQMVASLVSQQCDRGLLVYPKIAGDVALEDGTLRWWRIKGERYLIAAVALPLHDIGTVDGLRRFDENLSRTMSEVVSFEVKDEHGFSVHKMTA